MLASAVASIVRFSTRFPWPVIVLAIGLFGLRLAASNAGWWLADVVFLSFVFVQIALLGHDVVHLQFVRAGRVNATLGLIPFSP